MYWGEFHLALTLLVFYFVKHDQPSRIAMYGLVLWAFLEKFIYEPNVSEVRATMDITGVFLIYLFAAYIWKPAQIYSTLAGFGLLGYGVALFYGESLGPWWFGAAMNLIYDMGLMAVWATGSFLSRFLYWSAGSRF